MAVNKIDPKVIFASEAPAQDTPAVFTNRTVGWGETRKNGGRPTIKQMNAEQQSTDLKILWLNENSVTPYDPTIDYPSDAVTIKDGIFKIFDGSVWGVFLDKTDIGLGNVDNTSDLNKSISTATQTALDLKADKVFIDNTLLLQQEINDRGGATWYVKSGGYNLNDRVILNDGDIVRSTSPNNTANPNVDMAGWVKVNSTTQIYDDILGLHQSEINKRSSDVLRWITPQMFGAKGDGTTDDSQAFSDCVAYATSQSFVPVIGSNPMLGAGILIPATKGGYRIAQPRKFVPNLGTTRYLGLVIEGDGLPRIHFDYNDDDYLCYNNNQFLLLKFKNLDFSCNSDLSKFIYSTANGGAQDYSFDNCNWNGVWQKLFVLRGANNNSEWGWNKCGITCSIRDVMLDITDSDQFLNYWFNQCKIWLYDGQCVRASAGGHIKFLFCDWSGLQGTRALCTSTKGKYLFEFTGSSHARGVCDFRIIGGRFECKINSAGNGINARLLYCEWNQGNVELSFDASSTIISEFDNEYSIHMNRGNTSGAALSIRSSFLIGKLKFESSTAAFEKNKHTISDTTFGAFNLTRPSDFIEINSPSPNPSGAIAVKLDNCRPSVGNSVFNLATLTFTPWDLTLGSRNSLSAGTAVNIAEFKGSGYGGNPISNNSCYLRLPANSTILSVRVLCDGTGTTAMDSTWEITDDSTGTILLTCATHKLNQRWIEKSEIPYRSTTGLLKLVDKTAGGQTQSTAGFKCIVEYVC